MMEREEIEQGVVDIINEQVFVPQMVAGLETFIAVYIESAIEKALTDKKIEDIHLWNTLLKKEGLEKRIDQAKEEIDELDEQLDLVKYKPSQKLSPKERIDLRDEIVDVGMMLDSLMVIFDITPKSVAMRKLNKMETVKGIAYGKHRNMALVQGNEKYANKT